MLAPEQKESQLGHGRGARGLPDLQGRHGRRLLRARRRRAAAASRVRVLRDNVVIHDGELDSLKRFKDDVREVKARLRVRPVDQELQRRPEGRPARGLRDRRGLADAVALARLSLARAADDRTHTFAARAARRRADPARARRAAAHRGQGPARRAWSRSPRSRSRRDLSHAKVFFTHLAGREHADEAVRGAAAHRRLPAQRAVAPASSTRCRSSTSSTTIRSSRGMRLSQLIDDAVAADRKHRLADGRPPAVACRPPRRRVDGVLLLDKPLGLSSNAALQRAQAPATRARRPGTPARSTRSRPACCRSASARRPSSRSRCSTRPRRTSRPCASASRRPPATPRARSSRTRAGRRSTAPSSKRRCARFVGTIVQVPPRHSALKRRRPRLLRVRARRRRDPARAARRSRSPRSSWSTGRRRDAVAATSLLQGHLRARARRGHRRRAWLRARTSRRCGARRPGGFALDDAVTLEALEGDGRARRATRCCCRSTRRWSRPRAARRRRDDGAGASRRAQAATAPDAAPGTFALLRSGGTLRRVGRSDGRRAARRCGCAAHATRRRKALES